MQSECKMCGLLINTDDQYCRNCGFRTSHKETEVHHSVVNESEPPIILQAIPVNQNNRYLGLITSILLLLIILTIVSLFLGLRANNEMSKSNINPIIAPEPNANLSINDSKKTKDPLDQFIDNAIGKKLGGSSGATTASPQVRQASQQELREANQAIQNGQQLMTQNRYKEAADLFYFAKERAVGTEVGKQAQRLYDDASGHTDLFGGAIKRGQ